VTSAVLVFGKRVAGIKSSSEGESVINGVSTLGAPAGGTTRRRPPNIQLSSVDNVLR